MWPAAASVAKWSTMFVVITIYSCFPWMAQSAPTPPVICPTGWFGFEKTQTCYKPYHNLKLTYGNARQACRRQGGDLLTFIDAQTMYFIAGHLASHKWYITRIYKDPLKPEMNEEEVDMSLFATRINGTQGIGTVSLKDGELWLQYRKYGSLPFICERRSPKYRSSCRNKWTMYTDQDGHTSCIKVRGTGDRKSWNDAKTQCQSAGGHLITLENSETNTFVKDLLSGPPTYWIQNLPYPDKIPFLQWHEGAPTNNSEDTCLYLKDYSVGHHLFNTRCDETFPYICEIDSLIRTRTSCRYGWHEYKGETCIKIFMEEKTWHNANDRCQEVHGNLVVIPDEPTDDFINGIIKRYVGFWSGGGKYYPNKGYRCEVRSKTWLSGYVTDIVSCWQRFRFRCQNGEKPAKHTPTNYYTAKRICSNDGGLNLDVVQYEPSTANWFNIGLKENAADNDFHWVNGSTLGNFNNWGKNEPHNGQGCVSIYLQDENEMKWQDTGCHQQYYFICQTPPDIVTVRYCPDGWVLSPNHLKCFKFYRDDQKNCNEAEKQCQVDNDHGTLFTIGDEKKNTFIIEHITSGPNAAWIGARYDQRMKTFVWDSNGERLTYNGTWKGTTAKPSRGTGCGSISRYAENNTGYVWDNAACDTKLPYICQTDDVFPPTVFTCPEGYTTFREGDSCFKVYHNEQALDWETARKVCQQEGGDLAIVYDKAMDAFVAGLLSKSLRYWIGLEQYGDNTEWKWLDGTTQKLSGDEWLPGDPNGLGDLCVRYVHPNWIPLSTLTKHFYWADAPCERAMSFVCQHKGHTGFTGLKEYTIDGRSYYISYDTLSFSDVENTCQFYNLTHLFIESNDNFKQLQAWVSNTSFLQDDGIWIQTKKPLFWDFNTWSDNDFVSPDAWVSDIQDRVCSKEQNCCVTMARDTQKTGHYLTNTNCSETALYICVKENYVAETDIPPPKLVADNKKSMAVLRETMAASNKTINNKCPCRCGMNFDPNPSPEVLEEMKAQIVKKLIVKTANLSAKVFKKTSAPDIRASSRSIGYLAVLMLLSVVFLIIGADCIRFYQWIKK